MSDSLKDFCKKYDKSIAQIDIERYGFGKELRRFAKIPSFFPLRINAHHGIYMWDKPHPREYTNSHLAMLVFSESYKEQWDKLSNKPCYVIKHPFLLYKKRNKIKYEGEENKGSVFFLVHSSTDIDASYDPYEIIEKLKSLPDEFKPVTICLYYMDILKDRHLPFIDNGFTCVTAGHMYNTEFIDNFYQILTNHKYALSNQIGSHTFYTLDLGVPFSLIGEEPNHTMPDTLTEYNERENRKIIHVDLLKELIGNKLNKENRKEIVVYARNFMGYNSKISNKKIKFILITTTIKYYFKKIIKF
ncbi:hypothetical protein [Penaeicola halotolerans]|uniref:hypothetical protein n=1 Tax=Penaeicola halotolerans TaxID=2793196 RepID=UPI001CF833A3|nr:hypothetical protein [Penaeicola halotolerans]